MPQLIVCRRGRRRRRIAAVLAIAARSAALLALRAPLGNDALLLGLHVGNQRLRGQVDEHHEENEGDDRHAQQRDLQRRAGPLHDDIVGDRACRTEDNAFRT